MAHGKLIFIMPASSTDAFEAFFNHSVRVKWDTLLSVNYVEGGGTHPYVGAISMNRGRGWKTNLAMRTRFLSYDPPRQASAQMVAPTGPFAVWAASMRFKNRDDGTSELTYVFSVKLRPKLIGRMFNWLAGRVFAWETRRRFAALADYLRK